MISILYWVAGTVLPESISTGNSLLNFLVAEETCMAKVSRTLWSCSLKASEAWLSTLITAMTPSTNATGPRPAFPPVRAPVDTGESAGEKQSSLIASQALQLVISQSRGVEGPSPAEVTAAENTAAAGGGEKTVAAIEGDEGDDRPARRAGDALPDRQRRFRGTGGSAGMGGKEQ